MFTQPVFPSVTDISTTARDNVWVLWWDLGTQTYTSHWDGGTWDTVPVNTAATGLADSDAIWTGGQDVAFLAGRSGSSADPYAPRSLRFDAGVWELLPVSGVAGEPLLDVWGTAPTDLWTVGYDHFLHGDGSQWTPVPAPLPARYTLSHIHGTAPDNVWTVGIPYLGTGLTALRLDGGTWEDVSPPAGGENYPEDLWVAGPDEAWIVAQGSSTNWMLHRQAGAWTTVDISTGVHAVWGAAPDDVWFAGEGGLSHWDGRQASPVDLSSLDAGTLWGLAGSGPDDVWAWGPNAVLHFQR